MPTIRHPSTEATAEVPAAVVPFWTGTAGWQLVDDAPPATVPPVRRRRRRPAASSSTTSTPAPVAGALDVDPGQGSSTTAHPKE